MIAARLILQQARAAGVSIDVDGGELRLRAPKPPPADLVAAIKANKPDIIRLLAPVPLPGDDAPSWRRWFTLTAEKWCKRGRTLADALPLAFGEAVNLWHSRHGAKPPSGICAACRKPAKLAKLPALPDGAAVCDEACLIKYGATWRAAATAGLAKLGIVNPSNGDAQ